MGLFFGTSTHNVDAKGRFSLPHRIRQALPPDYADVFVFFLGLEGCLYGYSVPAFNELESKVTALGVGTAPARGLMEVLGGTTTHCEIDTQGRVLVPPAILKMVGITDSVVVVGAMKYVSLWNPERYAARLGEVLHDYEAGMRQHLS